MGSNYNYYLNFLRNRNEANLFSFLIRCAENTPYNHVEISVEPKFDGEELFYGAVVPKSRVTNLEGLKKHYRIVKRRKLNPIVGTLKCNNILRAEMDKEYSILQNIVIELNLVFHRVTNWFRTVKLNLDKYLQCTELAAIFLRDACGKKIDNVEVVSLKDLDCDSIGELDLNFIPDED